MIRSSLIGQPIGLSLTALLLLSGCESNKPASGTSASSPVTQTQANEAEHDHPTEGPHHGDIVELGNEEYHAEIVHGNGGEVSIYLLDSKAKNPVPIDAPEVVINLSHDGQAEQFKLPAVPETGDPAGQASKFSLKNEELSGDLDSEGTSAKLVITINGKSYSGKIEHHHEDGHDHDKDHDHDKHE